MTVSATIRRAGPYIGNGSTTEFSFAFKVFNESEVYVAHASDDSNEVRLELNVDYAVTLNADQDNSPGGTVKLKAALPEGHRLSIISDVPYDQKTQFTNKGGFYPETLNLVNDKAVALTQQLLEKVSRAVTTDATDERTPRQLLQAIFDTKDNAHASATAAASSAAASAASASTSKEYADKVTAFKDEIVATGQNISSVKTTAENVSAINDVADNAANVTTVAENISSVQSVASDIAGVVSVAQNEANVNVVAANIDQVAAIGEEARQSQVSAKASADSAMASASSASNSESNASDSKLKAATYSMEAKTYRDQANKIVTDSETLGATLSDIENRLDAVGVYTNSFLVAAGSTHSSTLNKVVVSIPAGTEFVVNVATSAPINLGIFVYGESGSIGTYNATGVTSFRKAITLEQDAVSVGIYTGTASVDTQVSFEVFAYPSTAYRAENAYTLATDSSSLGLEKYCTVYASNASGIECFFISGNTYFRPITTLALQFRANNVGYSITALSGVTVDTIISDIGESFRGTVDGVDYVKLEPEKILAFDLVGRKFTVLKLGSKLNNFVRLIETRFGQIIGGLLYNYMSENLIRTDYKNRFGNICAYNKFSVKAGATHPSSSDNVSTNIPAGARFAVHFNSSANVGIQIFCEGVRKFNISSAKSRSVEFIADTDITKVGIYVDNGNDVDCDVSFYVASDDQVAFGSARGFATSDLSLDRAVNVYLSNARRFKFVSERETSGAVRIGFSGETINVIVMENAFGVPISTKGYSIEDVINDIGDGYAVTDGDETFIRIPVNYALYYSADTATFSVEATNNNRARLVCLFAVRWGQLAGGILAPKAYYDDASQRIDDASQRIDDASQRIDNLTVESQRHLLITDGKSVANFEQKVKAYADLFIGSDDAESFVYFTDPHIMSSGGAFSEDAERAATATVATIARAFNRTATSFVMCGGDWLIDRDPPSAAAFKLSFIDGLMRQRFGDRYYPVIGNHDTNYQGVDADGNARSGRLPDATLRNLWFREYGSSYYTFKAKASRFYVLDTELDWYDSHTERAIEQAKWFARNLLENDDRHSVVSMHIVSIQKLEDLQSSPSLRWLANEVSLIAKAYNARTTCNVEGEEFDFSASTGKVACIICGHSHFDYSFVFNDIPIVITKNSTFTPDFDLVFIDFTKGKYFAKRIGSGEDREIDIVV